MAWKQGGLIFALVVITLLAARFASTEAGDVNDYSVINEISVDGPALFFVVKTDTRHEIWSVSCHQPLRGCIARAPGLVLRLDAANKPWLITVLHPGAHTSIQAYNVAQPADALFSKPLDPIMVERLSAGTSVLVVEENEKVALHTRTTALDQVISYLIWLNSKTAHTLRDARLWPNNGVLNIDRMTPEVRQRYDVMKRRASEVRSI